MKIMICTTPIRPVPTNYPPFGSLAVIQALRGAGYDPVFFDIDAWRSSFDEVIERFRQERPDVIGISAVVSTAYGYVKKLCLSLRQILPDVKIVIGGNLAASAELLHRFCGVDVCVIGEGEIVAVNLADYYCQHPHKPDHAALGKIKGITCLDQAGNMVFTGYEEPIAADHLFEPDFSILEQYSKIDTFIADPFTRGDFAQDPRSHEPHRRGKKMATVVATKGCVARCTFCHRWDRGFRQRPPEKLVARIRHLTDRYDVGFIQFGDENFGSDRKATDKLLELIKPLDILWQVGGVRTRTIDRELLTRMHDAGCVALYYGFETGSPNILKVMEKNLDLSHNYSAARLTREAGLNTVYQVVLGMPGETPGTVGETIEMLKKVTEDLPAPPFGYLSINYIQALPGTPVYEFARRKGLIGPRLEDEDAYLLSISDLNAADDSKFLNFTDYPYLTVQTWRRRILWEVAAHWYRIHSRRSRATTGPSGGEILDLYEKGGYFNLHALRAGSFTIRMLYAVRHVVIWLRTLWVEYRRASPGLFFARVRELLIGMFNRRERFTDYRSLRAVMKDLAPPVTSRSEEAMRPLRLGR